MAAVSLAACEGGDAPTQPPAPPVTPPPAQNPEPPPPAPTLGALIVELSDVPNGAQPQISVSSGGIQRVVRQSRTVDSLPPGIYEVKADDIVIDSVRYSPEPSTQSVQVLANNAAPRVHVRFQRAGAAITITSTGLPSYARATVRLNGPDGVTRTALTNDTVRLLPAGDYTLTADPVETTDGRFVPSPETVAVKINGNQVGTANFRFVLAKGSLTITANGLPNGALAGIRVTGPAGFNERADATQRFDGLEAGTYRATAARVQAGGFSYDPNRTSADVVISGTQSRSMDFNYALATGAIAVTISGLPSGTNGSVSVTGPSGYARTVTSTETLINLAPGAYRVTAASVSANGVSYTATPGTLDVTVSASIVAVPAAIQYAGSMGAMALRVEGLPPSLNASVKVIRPNGTSFWLTGSETVRDLPIGTYTVEPQVVKGPKDSYDPDVSSRKVQLRKDETVETAVRYSPRNGGINVSVLGLPAGVLASVRVSGAGTDTVFTTSGTLANLPVGSYTITAANVVSGGTQYVASPASASVTVARGVNTPHTVSYGGQSTALTVNFTGLPGGTSPSAVVTGPNGYSTSLTASRVLENLAAGTYRVTSATVTTSTAVYTASPSTVDVALSAGDRKSQQVAYTLSTGSLAVSVAGLPNGINASVTVSGPGGFSRTLTGSETLIKLTPGTYTVSAQNVSANGSTFTASPASRTVTVTASITAAAAPISYGAAFGGMRVMISGLPTQVAGAVTLNGPNSAWMSLSQTAVVGNLAIGAWELRANDVTVNGDTYSSSPSTRSVSVVASDTVDASVVFARATGHLAITVNGLPSGTNANITVTGPNNFSRSVTASQTLVGLAAGTYTVSAAAVNSGSTNFAPSATSQSVTLSSGGSAARTVSYSGSTTSLSVNVSGVPGGAAPSVTVTGPSGFSQEMSSTSTLSGLNAGTYVVTAARVVAGSYGYVGVPASQSVSLATGENKSASVAYAVSTGALTVNIAGLPTGTSAPVTVTGPSGFTRSVSNSQTLTDLAPGSYTVTAGSITSGSSSFTPGTASQAVSVSAGVTASRSITYTSSTTSLSINVSGVPNGASPVISVSGPSGFSQTLSGTNTLTGLSAGTYTVAAARVVSGNYGYTASPASQSVALSAGENKSAAVAYSASTGALTVNITGLPSGSTAPVTVTGPNSFTRSVPSSQTLGDLAPGTYTVAAGTTTSGSSSYTPSSASQTVTVTAGATASRSVTYTGASTSLAVNVSGVPNGASPVISVTGPSGFSQTTSTTQTFTGLTAGSYTVAAARVVAGNYGYTGSPASQSVALATGEAKSAAVAYAVSTGALTANISGLPSGTSAPVTVTGPNSFTRSVPSSQTLGDLAPGTYTVAAGTTTSGSSSYTPSSASQTVTVTAGATASRSVTYTGASTSLAVNVSGVPNGASPVISVTGPSGFSQTTSTTQTFTGLTAGSYTVAAARVVAGNYGYTGSPASQSVALATGEAKSAAVAYAVSTGALTVNVSGLPAGTSASITVTGPSGVTRAVTSSQTLGDLAPGSYTVAATSFVGGTTSYTPSSTSQTVSVTAGATASRSVTYTGSATTLAITLGGLPSGVNGAVTVTGPNSYSQNITSTTTLSGLAAGSYTIAGAPVTGNGFTYAATPASASVSIATGTSTSRSVTYAATTGKLSVSVSGLPSGTNAAVQVTGPNSFSQNVTASTTLNNLAVGTYTVAASNVTSGGSTYAPSSASQTIGVTAGATASRTVTYAVSGGGGGGGGGGSGGGTAGANLIVEGAYVTQAIQSFAGTVPLVAGRGALLRVFVRADASNSLSPTVRVRLSTGGSPFRTFTINAPSSSVPTSISEGTLNSSWNAQLTPSDMRAGLRIQVDVDPTNAVAESDETDNIWPRSGTQALDVRSVAPVNVVFVPVHRTADGSTGNVTSSNMESNFASMSRRMFPLSSLNASVRAPYTTNAADLQSGDGNRAWLTILSEMSSLRTADGSSAYYYGVVSTSYGSGVAGYAYTPGRAAVGWDKSSTSNRITAHELGHNFGRRHVAACLSGNTDANYPHAGGVIGHFGWNSGTGGIVNSTVTDIMGYCGTQWISDYTWTAVMNYVGAAPMMAGFSTGPQTSLLVWGRTMNGQVTLEPAVRLVTTPSVAQRPGAYRLELRDADGRVLTGFTFDPEVVDHDENAGAFSFAVPLSAMADSRLASVAIVGPSGTVEQVSRVAAASMVGANEPAPVLITADNGSTTVTDPSAVITRSGNVVRVNWDAQTWPLAMVKDAQSGQTLSYLRESGHGFLPRGSAVRVIFSNGVQSVTKILNVP